MANFINTFNGLVWATPLIALTFGGALLYTIILKFCIYHIRFHETQ